MTTCRQISNKEQTQKNHKETINDQKQMQNDQKLWSSFCVSFSLQYWGLSPVPRGPFSFNPYMIQFWGPCVNGWITDDTFASLSPCSSSDLSLWLIKDTGKTCLEPDEGFWNGDHLPTLSEKVNSSDTSSMSFSGPYILCQVSYSQPQPGPFVRFPGVPNS